MFDTKALLLINNNETQVLKLHIRREQPVGTNNDIDAAGRQTSNRGFYFTRSFKSREPGKVDRKTGVSLTESIHMLGYQESGGNQDSYLFPILDCLKSRTHRDLSLSVPHIATDHSVHRDRALHVGFHIIDCCQLIRRLLIWKSIL